MKNQEVLTKRLSNGVSKKLQSELDYYMDDVDHEDEYTICDAFDDAVDMIGLTKEIKYIYVDIGYVRPVDISKVVSTGKKYWFKIADTHYEAVMGWNQWIVL